MSSELGKSRVYGYQFRPHDGAGLFSSRNIYVDGSSVGGNVYHRRHYAEEAGYVKAVGVGPYYARRNFGAHG